MWHKWCQRFALFCFLLLMILQKTKSKQQRPRGLAQGLRGVLSVPRLSRAACSKRWSMAETWSSCLVWHITPELTTQPISLVMEWTERSTYRGGALINFQVRRSHLCQCPNGGWSSDEDTVFKPSRPLQKALIMMVWAQKRKILYFLEVSLRPFNSFYFKKCLAWFEQISKWTA